MAKLNLSYDYLLQKLFPGANIRITTVWNAPMGGGVTLHIDGEGVPDCDEVLCIATKHYDTFEFEEV